MNLSRSIKIVAVASAAALFAVNPAMASGVTISGAGSSFVAPLIGACKTAWQDSTGNTVAYGSGGSGKGRSNADAQVGEFNFSDATYAAKSSTMLQIPVAAAPIAVAYNLNTTKTLYLSQKTIADIFGGKVTMWNDPEIAADNSGASNQVVFKKDAAGNVAKNSAGQPIVLKTISVKRYFTLPNQKIKVIYRSDSSGTTQNFVNLLISQYPSVWNKPSNGLFSAAFPGNINDVSNLGRITSANGNEGVAALAEKTKYSITYAEASYATSHHLGKAAIKNAAGNYQLPDAGGTAAFLGASTVASDGKLTFNYDTKLASAYVYGIVSYALADSANTGASAAAVKSFLTYMVDPKCASTDPKLEYTTITGDLFKADLALIAKLQG